MPRTTQEVNAPWGGGRGSPLARPTAENRKKMRELRQLVERGELPSSHGMMTTDADFKLLLSHFRAPGGSRARSIAVIASSGTLLHTGFGALIDAHDVHIRFNDAPTAGFEEDVYVPSPRSRAHAMPACCLPAYAPP